MSSPLIRILHSLILGLRNIHTKHAMRNIKKSKNNYQEKLRNRTTLSKSPRIEHEIIILNILFILSFFFWRGLFWEFVLPNHGDQIAHVASRRPSWLWTTKTKPMAWGPHPQKSRLNRLSHKTCLFLPWLFVTVFFPPQQDAHWSCHVPNCFSTKP